MAHAALTDAQRAQIRFYLGWPSRFHQIDSGLEQAMSAIDMGDDESYAVITRAFTHTDGPGLLASLKDVDAKLLTADDSLEVEQVGTIKLNLRDKVALLRSKGRQFAGRLAALLSVELRHDVFAGRGPLGQLSNLLRVG